MYQALYRKWRPQSFADVVGQGHITQTLQRQVQSGRLSHAYLFTGTRGTGKTTCAKLLARAVNCQQPQNGDPCNQCPACQGIESGAILDVLELDAASNNRVDDIRAILDEAVYAPAAVKKRVYIVDEVHMLSTQAFNALLQILEEPPAHLMFILATTEIHKVPATIKSRCQQFAFKRIHAEEIAARLCQVAQQEGLPLSEGGAALIARLADGGMRDALSLLDQCAGQGGEIDEDQVRQVLGLAGNLETAALLETVADGDVAQALSRLDRLYAGGKEMEALAGELSALVRDLLVRKTAPEGGSGLMTGGYDEGTLRRLTGRFDAPRLAHMLRTLQETGAGLKGSANRRTDMELCLVTLCDPSLDPSPAALAARVARLEQGGVISPAPRGEMTEEGKAAPEGKGTAAGSPAFVPGWEPIPAEAADEKPPISEPAEAKPPVPLPEAGGETPLAPTGQAAGEPVPVPQPVPPSQGEEADGSPTRQWPGWEALLEQLKGKLEMSEFAFLGNRAMVRGDWNGRELTLWTANDFLRGRMDRPVITQAVAQAAQALMGGPVRVGVRIGEIPAPAQSPASAGTGPEQGQPEEASDALEAFLRDSQGNVSVE